MRGNVSVFVLLAVLLVSFVGSFVVFKGVTGELVIPAGDLLAAALKGNKDACQDLQRTCGTDWRGCRGVSSRVRSACKPFTTMSTSTPSLPAPTINIPTTTTPTPTVTPTAPKTPQVNVPTSIKPTLTKAQVWAQPVKSIRTCIKAPCPVGTSGVRVAMPKTRIAIATPKTAPAPTTPTATTEPTSPTAPAEPIPTTGTAEIKTAKTCTCLYESGTKISCTQPVQGPSTAVSLATGTIWGEVWGVFIQKTTDTEYTCTMKNSFPNGACETTIECDKSCKSAIHSPPADADVALAKCVADFGSACTGIGGTKTTSSNPIKVTGTCGVGGAPA